MRSTLYALDAIVDLSLMRPSRRKPRRNIVMIVADDHQHDALGCAGHPDVLTPVLDQLAARGARFSRASIMGSLVPAVRSPARACLLTGGHITHANVDPRPLAGSNDTINAGSRDFVSIPPRLATLPELCREAGYRTFITGKWHNDVPSMRRSFAEGERIFVGGMSEHNAVPVRSLAEIQRAEPARISMQFSTKLFCDAALKFIFNCDRAQPFFCYVALTSPHDPRTPPAAFRRLYMPAELRLPPAFRAAPAFDNGELGVRDELLLPKPIEPAALREELADYYGMISHQDAQIGRILTALADRGFDREIYVVYIGDHGLALGRHGLMGKQNHYEHSIRMPLIVAGPDIRPGVRRGLVYSLDVFATLLELAGLSPSPERASISLVSQLADPGAGGRAELCALYCDCQRAIRQERWKLIHYYVTGRHRAELFDLDTDPHEECDRAEDPACAGVIAALSSRLDAWRDNVGDRWMPRTSACHPARHAAPIGLRSTVKT